MPDDIRAVPGTSDEAEVAALKARMLKKVYFVMQRVPRDLSRIKPAVLAHYRWIIELEKQGAVFASGPLTAEDGASGIGMTVFRCDGWDEARRLSEGDPFVQQGAVTFELHQWQINEGRVTVAIDFSDQTCTFS